MIFVLNVLTIVYLYFQRYFHNSVLPRAFAPENLADYFYLFELLVFSVAYFLNGKKNFFFTKTLVSLNVIVIFALEILRKSDLANGSYILGYPLSKIIVAGGYFVVFSFALFITLFYLLRLFGEFSYLRVLSVEALVVTALLFAALYFNLSYADRADIFSARGAYDYAVVLGAAVDYDKPFPIFRKRIEKARELYDKKIVKKIFLTGGSAPGEKTEAEVARKYLLSKEIPSWDLDKEEKTATTFEQIKFLKKFFDKRKDKIIIVSDSFHLARVKMMCRFLNLKAETVSSGLRLRFEKKIYYTARDSLALLLFLFFAI